MFVYVMLCIFLPGIFRNKFYRLLNIFVNVFIQIISLRVLIPWERKGVVQTLRSANFLYYRYPSPSPASPGPTK